jgi:hypothetical protein
MDFTFEEATLLLAPLSMIPFRNIRPPGFQPYKIRTLIKCIHDFNSTAVVKQARSSDSEHNGSKYRLEVEAQNFRLHIIA